MALKGLVTFGLWGDKPLYYVGALRNLQIWLSESPFDVDCRIYVSNEYSEPQIFNLEDMGAQIVRVSEKGDQTSTFWRWRAFGDAQGYDYILSRDLDSRPYDREFYCITEWLESNLPVHMIRDHPYHGVPMLAGLFGVKKGLFPKFTELIPHSVPENFFMEINQKYKQTYPSNDFYQVDQHWLRRNVFPRLRNHIMGHDEFFGFERKRFRRPLPPRDPDSRFCGEGFDEYENPRWGDHRDLINGWPKRAT